ncbi:MAG: hypothetical protein ACPGJV_00515 [Bacteriovoracaceae bacterium]
MLQKNCSILSILIVFYVPLVLGQKFEAPSGQQYHAPNDITELLYNQVEIQKLAHDKPTKVHSRAKLKVRYSKDPRGSVQDHYIEDFQRTIFEHQNQDEFQPKHSDSLVESYMGNDPESGFAFLLRVERDPRRYRIRNVTEIIKSGETLNGRPVYKSQTINFADRQADSHTQCAGVLTREKPSGGLSRLYASHNEDKSKEKLYPHLRLKCKTLTRSLCHSIYRQKDEASLVLKHERAPLFDRVEKDINDPIHYQRTQKRNIHSLSHAGLPFTGEKNELRPISVDFHKYEGIGENGERLSRKELDWFIHQCESKISYFFAPRNLFPKDEEEQNGDSRGGSSGGQSLGIVIN